VQHEKIVLPTVAQTEAGFFVDVEPIQVFRVEEHNAWKNAIYKALVKGNSIIPTPDGSDEPGSAILEKLNISKWSTFETSSIMYTVHRGGGDILIYRTGKSADGMWSTETNQRHFASRAPLTAIVDALCEDVLKQPEANRPKTSLMPVASTSTAPTTLMLPGPTTSSSPSASASGAETAASTGSTAGSTTSSTTEKSDSTD